MIYIIGNYDSCPSYGEYDESTVTIYHRLLLLSLLVLLSPITIHYHQALYRL